MKITKNILRKLKELSAKLSGKLNAHEQGSALIIVTLILALLTVYISASLMSATTDAISSNFAVSQKRAFYSAYSKMEQMTGDFSNLFLTSLSPSYDSMCRVVISNPVNLNGFNLSVPNVTCPNGAPCTAGYSGKFMSGTNLYDLGWEGDPLPTGGFCLVDVCNPTAAPACNFPLRPTNTVTIQKGDFTGLQGFARRFRMVSTASSAVLGGADTQITRDFNNYLLPVFQFGIFTDTDFELLLPPPWTFGGWVHTNGDFYATGGDDANGKPRNVFSQYAFDATGKFVRQAGRITVAKHILIGTDKTGDSTANSYINVYKTGTTFDKIVDGTVFNGTKVSNCNQIIPSVDAANGTCNPSFTGTSSGTVKTGVRALKLPIQNLLGANPIEIIKRGLPSDLNPSVSSPFLSARFYYKPGIRVTMADYQAQLPRQVIPNDPVSEGSGPYGGIQLDGPDPYLGATVGTGNAVTASTNANWYYEDDGTGKKWPIPRGYQPKVKSPTTGNPRATGARVNGYRVHGWIKVEIVKADGTTLDITEEILNLGVTVPYNGPKDTSATALYYPRATAAFPTTLPLVNNTTSAFPDENSILHLQRFAVPYFSATIAGSLPATIQDPVLDDVSNMVRFDYYGSMALRDYDDRSLKMFGIEDNKDLFSYNGGTFGTYVVPPIKHATYTTRYDISTNPASPVTPGSPITVPPTIPIFATSTPYAEPQPDPGGYYTDAARVPATSINNLFKTEIDFTGLGGTNRGALETTNVYGNNNLNYNGGVSTPFPFTKSYPLSENVNLPKAKGDPILATPESTWSLYDNTTSPGALHHLVPFPVNVFDSREGTPHEPRSGATVDPPVSGMIPTSPSKNGTINLVEIDMGNLGRLLKGEFDGLFAQMGNTAYKASTGVSLSAASIILANPIHDNITVNQDSGWIVYLSDRRGDEPMLQSNPNIKPPSSQYSAAPNVTNAQLRNSVIGDGEYNREDVVWSQGGNTGGGNAAAVPVQTGAQFGCTPGSPIQSNNQDAGKSPQDSNNDCFIASEEATGNKFSETAKYDDIFDEDQYNDNFPFMAYSPTLTSPSSRRGVGVAMTQVGTVKRQGWSAKPPVTYRDSANDLHVEMFRRAVRLVNAANLFPTGPRVSACGGLLGVSITTENPVYVFGNFNAPAGTSLDVDSYPGISGAPPSLTTAGTPTGLDKYNGQDFATCGNNCHVPTSIISDAISFLSGACVGTSLSAWGGGTGAAGWLDSRSFMSPYQAIALRPARNTVWRFAAIAGFTPTWNPTYWGNTSINQGPTNAGGLVGYDYSSGGLNNFPRFLEDWGQNGGSQQFAIYGGSLIRIFKSRQANGATKRILSNSVFPKVDYAYVPPNRDWVFDLDFSRPCTLPPGAPFLQLIDFKGFQESVQQQK